MKPKDTKKKITALEDMRYPRLTTATTVWCCLAVGCLAADGYLLETFIATFVILAVNLFLKPVDEWLTKSEIDEN